LGLLGINIDFAPVFDLFDGSAGTAMGSRCASEDPLEAATAAGAFLSGLESTGVRGCLKHFPGLGGTAVDSHVAMPCIEDPIAIERNVAPFLAAASPGRLVMVAHLQTPFSGGLPASLHRGHVAENRWGMRGRWIPDDMEMGGCMAPDWRTRAKMAIEAGHMALLVCQTIDAVQQAADAAEVLDDSVALPAIEEFRSLRRELLPAPTRFDKESWESWAFDVAREASQFN
jgi:beta-N-acetylhexosaminidase